MHAHSEIVVPLNQEFARFSAEVGVPEDVAFGGSVRFLVYLDGELAYASQIKTAGDAVSEINIDVTATSEMRMVVTDADGSINSDHAVWAGARLEKPAAQRSDNLLFHAQGDSYNIFDQTSGQLIGVSPISLSGESIISGSHSETIELVWDADVGFPIRFDAAAGDDVVHVSSLEFSQISGGPGNNTIVFDSEILEINLASEELVIRNFDRIELSPNQPQTLVVSPRSLRRFASNQDKVTIVMARSDTLSLQGEWQVTSEAIDGEIWHRVTSDEIAMLLANDRPWTNPISRHDVSGDGEITSADAFRIINRLSRSTSDQIHVQDLSSTPPDYLDVNASGTVTANDALIVINELSRTGLTGRFDQGIAPVILSVPSSQAAPFEVNANMRITFPQFPQQDNRMEVNIVDRSFALANADTMHLGQPNLTMLPIKKPFDSFEVQSPADGTSEIYSEALSRLSLRAHLDQCR